MRVTGIRCIKSLRADILQPDPSHAGAILEVRKIAVMAEAFDVAVALHCPLGPIALAAALQVDACTPHAIIQEEPGHPLQPGRRFASIISPIPGCSGMTRLCGDSQGTGSRHRDR